jgi:hypothetical protein
MQSMDPLPQGGSPGARSQHSGSSERRLFARGAGARGRASLSAVVCGVLAWAVAAAPSARAAQDDALDALGGWWRRAPEAWPALLQPSLGTWGRGKAFAAGPVAQVRLPGEASVWIGAKLPLETAYGGDFGEALKRWVLATDTAESESEVAAEPDTGLTWKLAGADSRPLVPAPYGGFDPWYVGLLAARCAEPGATQPLEARFEPPKSDTPLTFVTLDREGAQLVARAEFLAPMEGDLGAAGGFVARIPDLSVRMSQWLLPGAILVDDAGRWCGTLIERRANGRLEFQGAPLAWPWPARLEFSSAHERVLDATAHPQLSLSPAALTTCLSNPMLGGLRCLGPEGQIWSQRGWRSAAPDASGGFIAAGHADGRLVLLDAREGTDIGELARLEGSIEHLRWIDGARLVAGSLVRGWVARVDTDSSEPKWNRALTPTALAAGPAVLVGGPEGTVAFLAIADGSGKPRAGLHTAPVTAARWSADGQRAATGDARGRVLLWSAEGEVLRTWETGRAPVGGLAFAPGPEGRPCLWVGCGDLEEEHGDLYCFGANVRVLDLEHGREWARSPELDFPVTDLVHAPGRGLAAPASVLCISGRRLLAVRLAQ